MMFNKAIKQALSSALAKLRAAEARKMAVDRSTAMIEFKPDATFVAVPTPQLETGECNTAILEDVLQQLNKSKGLLVIVKYVSQMMLRIVDCVHL